MRYISDQLADLSGHLAQKNIIHPVQNICYVSLPINAQSGKKQPETFGKVLKKKANLNKYLVDIKILPPILLQIFCRIIVNF